MENDFFSEVFRHWSDSGNVMGISGAFLAIWCGVPATWIIWTAVEFAVFALTFHKVETAEEVREEGIATFGRDWKRIQLLNQAAVNHSSGWIYFHSVVVDVNVDLAAELLVVAVDDGVADNLRHGSFRIVRKFLPMVGFCGFEPVVSLAELVGKGGAAVRAVGCRRCVGDEFFSAMLADFAVGSSWCVHSGSLGLRLRFSASIFVARHFAVFLCV
mgnify:CR=1 FL=1